jgi:hypothetical protein
MPPTPIAPSPSVAAFNRGDVALPSRKQAGEWIAEAGR